MEKVKIWQPASAPELMLSQADYNQFSFEPHVHRDFHIGVVESGIQHFRHRGQSNQLGSGRIAFMNPDELHDGSSYQDGYRVRVFSIPPEWLEGQLEALAYFPNSLAEDPLLYSELLALHRLLQVQPDNIETESRLLEVFNASWARHANRQALDDYSLSQQQFETIKQLMYSQLEDKISLQQLADELDLSKFQLLRQFKNRVGMTPHSYLNRLRLDQSLRLLCKGATASEAAHAVGFYDQSHFNKAFKRAFGLPPGKILQ